MVERGDHTIDFESWNVISLWRHLIIKVSRRLIYAETKVNCSSVNQPRQAFRRRTILLLSDISGSWTRALLVVRYWVFPSLLFLFLHQVFYSRVLKGRGSFSFLLEDEIQSWLTTIWEWEFLLRASHWSQFLETPKHAGPWFWQLKILTSLYYALSKEA